MKININQNFNVYTNTDIPEQEYKAIVQMSLENKDNHVAIMPDYHQGKGCLIGTTIDLKGSDVLKINPKYVGVDIGCGVMMADLGDIDIDLEKLDKFIREEIPSGRNKNSKIMASLPDYYGMGEMAENHLLSLGSLGGGNHFIEIGVNTTNKHKILFVHSGSRKLGVDICNKHVKIAEESFNRRVQVEKENIIKNSKKENIQKELKGIKHDFWEKEYLYGDDVRFYLQDMRMAVKFARINRETIINRIAKFLKVTLWSDNVSDTIHNYIDDDMILRKGAISAKEGQLVSIPLNMKDGVILAIGKGNKDWNYSAPHGAGRIKSRSDIKKEVDLEEFKEAMKDVYSTSVNEFTLDESPMAYKPIKDIIDVIEDTVEIIGIIKPIYNFKSNN